MKINNLAKDERKNSQKGRKTKLKQDGVQKLERKKNEQDCSLPNDYFD